MATRIDDGPPRTVPAPRDVATLRTKGDRVFRGIATGAGSFTLILLVLIGTFLFL